MSDLEGNGLSRMVTVCDKCRCASCWQASQCQPDEWNDDLYPFDSEYRAATDTCDGFVEGQSDER